MKRLALLPLLCILTAALLPFACSGTRPPAEPTSALQPSPASSPTLIPRSLLFGNPERRTVRLSPDGAYLSFVAPLDGVLNIYVAPIGSPDAARPVTHDAKRGIYRGYFWTFSNSHILYLKDNNGDENWRVHSVNILTGEDKPLTPEGPYQARIENVSPAHPDEVLVSLNDRNPKYHEIYRLNVQTGELTRIQENDRFDGFLTDDDYNVRGASSFTPDGGSEFFIPDGAGGWKSFMKVGPIDVMTTGIFGFDKTGRIAYMIDSRERDKSALFALNLDTMQSTLLVESPLADIDNVFLHPTEHTVIAATATYDRTQWHLVDPTWTQDFEAIRQTQDGEVAILSTTRDAARLLVCFYMDDEPVSYYLYDRATRQTRFLFLNDQRLKGLPLSRMYPKIIPSRDGLNLVSYLTLPRSLDKDGRLDRPIPMVLLVHGGPWSRDAWGFNPEHLWLADRGYAVLSVNYRGSTGFGKAFINAANREWGGKMHDDLIDAVNWAVKEGIADPAKVAIMGWSYGGYATLAGLTMTPDTFACGVAGVGPANLITFMETIPPYWIPISDLFYQRIGDPRTEEGRQFLTSRSPLTYVGNIKKPLLIGHGANDPRVKLGESEQIVKAMQEKKIPVVFALYPDEGHGFARPENRMSFYSMAELMLGQCLGGPSQPIGDDFARSSVTVPVGAEILPGVPDALTKR